MSWWKRVLGRNPLPLTDARLAVVGMPLPGWTESPPEGDVREWRDSEGAVLTLAAGPMPFGWGSDPPLLRVVAREAASRRQAGLIEARTHPSASGSGASWIYKRLVGTGYVFTGMLFLPFPDVTQFWMVVDGERGMTGIREAVVTARLVETGALTLESYEREWARDPYEPEFAGVDRSVLRFMSDDESYDEQFPEHPLTRVRRIQAELRAALWPES